MKDNNNSGVESQQTGVIYKITCLITGKPYVGQTRQKLNRRIYGHKSNKGKSAIDVAIRKYGWENFSVEVLETCPVEKLNEREIFWIRELNSKAPNGYNLTDGGDGGLNPSEETRAKISANHADFSGAKNGFYGKRHSEESRAKMSVAKKGKSHKPHSQETRDKISASEKGKHVSEETRAKISSAGKGRKLTAETCARMSASKSGENNPNYGKHRPPEVCAKIAAAVKAAWARKKSC